MSHFVNERRQLVSRPLSWDEFVEQLKKDAMRLYGPGLNPDPYQRPPLPIYYVEAQADWFLSEEAGYRFINQCPVWLPDRLVALKNQIVEPIPCFNVVSTYAMEKRGESIVSPRLSVMTLSAYTPTTHQPQLKTNPSQTDPVVRIKCDQFHARLNLQQLKITVPATEYEIARFSRRWGSGADKATTPTALPWYPVFERKMVQYDTPLTQGSSQSAADDRS